MTRRNTRKRQAWGLPWFRRHDGYWYVTVRGKKHKLVKGEENREAALEEWHRIMALAEAEDTKQNNACWVIFEHFLQHKSQESQRSYENYRACYEDFADAHRGLRVGQLTPAIVNAWLASHAKWSDSTKAIAVVMILAALNWAAKPEQGLIDLNPIRGMKRPALRSRGEEAIIDDGDFETVCKVASPWVRDALIFLRQTGTRPGNLANITAETIDWTNRCVRLRTHKTFAKTGRAIVIPLTRVAIELLERLCREHPSGPLFLTKCGNPMIGKRLSESIDKLKRSLKDKGLALKGNFYAYGCRHTVATELLKADMTDAKVAAVLGHKDTKMLHHHYAHLSTESQAIAEQLDCVLNGDGASQADPAA
jgi:integrase/recombinase XerC